MQGLARVPGTGKEKHGPSPCLAEFILSLPKGSASLSHKWERDKQIASPSPLSHVWERGRG